ncbi:winged helix-turn-helix transcriptional regulator [Falsirhodobacter sp. 20TX0035]|uniref:winged helix-turn-helix transcriptional regulator n=1 Tax=Falsirhodobacter sp. 20TX0035 TaxID=3022019 RepID=UPI00232E8B8D|nr:helix-turn-helix domain-containing protein [Falsirhodobacter sp. 20TX0035]MDB6452925.1 helix-turn-helix domain-containing protein [Falsirhodobacter sp. 20TX0035]
MDGTRFSVDCPSRLLFEQIADKWSMMILTVLSEQPTRFNELKRRLEGVSQKSLSQTLRRLERNGLITRQVLHTTPISVEYALSPMGVTLLMPFRALYRWTCENMAEVEAARHAYDERTAA